MSIADLLSIVVPTYNRSDYIDFFLEIHIPLLEQYSIAIYVSDNASTDDTVNVLKKWQQRYEHLHWQTLGKNIHEGVQNYEKALTMSTAKYTWLIGDSYEIPAISFSIVLEFLKKAKTPCQFIVVDHGGQPSDLPEKLYKDPNEALEDLSWIMGCVGSTIYHNSVITEQFFQKERIQNRPCAFCHVSFILKYMTNQNVCLYWKPSAKIVTLKTRQRRYGWGDTFFELVFEDWPLTIKSLPFQFTDKSKQIAIGLIAKSPLLSWRRLLTLRAQNVLTQDTYSLYRDKIEALEPKTINLNMKIFILMPVIICKYLVFGIEWLRRKRYQLSQSLYTSRV